MFGQRLRLARKKAGLSMKELAVQVSPKVSAQAISKYEANKMMPSSAVLVGLGKVLDVSLDFLFGGQVESLCGVKFRKHSKTSAKDLALAEALVIEKVEDYFAIEDILDIEPLTDPFKGLRYERVASCDSVEDIAQKVRAGWNLGIDPIPSLTALLEKKGIMVIEVDLPERFHGLACTVKRSGERPDVDVVVVSSQANVERRRFSLAHELAHRVIQDVSSEINLEKAMHRFAGAFLIPREHLIAEMGKKREKLTYHEIVWLKKKYGVSAAAMLVRLEQVGIVSHKFLQYAFRSFARAWRSVEPEPIANHEGFGAFEKPQRFERLVWKAIGEELISPVRAAQFLKQPLEEIESEIKGPNK